jgi:hypothetical protein
MSHKLGICIPYRNRQKHLDELIPALTEHLNKKGIEHAFYIAHQTDDKLFNRGAMKNIAAKHAFDDGCDYIAWHDVDMIPNDDCDYSYPEEHPIHIATKLSKYNYGISYPEYFGGVILFTKEQVERTNGYSNDYWDWGMEDDDLFWRCQLEGYTHTEYLDVEMDDHRYINFNGHSSAVVVQYHQKLRSLTSNTHTISVLVRAEHDPNKAPVYLIGDKHKQYVEYPIFRIPGYDYGLSFNNSRALSFQFWTNRDTHNYMWAKRFENQWTWITATIDDETKTARLFLNGDEVDDSVGNGSKSPITYEGRLRNYGSKHLYIGATPTSPYDNVSLFFKGDIAKVYLWDTILTDEQIKNIHKELPTEGAKVKLDFNKGTNTDTFVLEAPYVNGDIKIPKYTLPFRRDGRFECLAHKDEGLVKGKWVKGETTARNEQRYITEMQQGKIDYKADGLNSLVYELVSVENIADNAKLINVTL